MRIYPPVIAAFWLLVAYAVERVYGVGVVSRNYGVWGLAAIAFGLWLLLWAQRQFRKNGTTVNPYETPKTLITTGPYSYTRNPMYLGLTLVLLGIAIKLGTAAYFLAPPAFLITIDRLFVPMEERKLEKLFRKKYLTYKSRVRRWV